MVQKVAIRSSADIIAASSDEVLKENNLDFFEKSMPGNLQLIEGLWNSDQENKTLLTILIKGYSSYAFAVLETNAYEEIILEKKSNKINAVLKMYEKAIRFGHRYLELIGIEKSTFENKNTLANMSSLLEKHISKEDEVALFYFLQAQGSSINLSRKNLLKMSMLGHIKAGLSWICKKNPDIEYGNCSLFESVIMASTPLVMGGNSEKSKSMFEDAMKKYPENSLIIASYIQYYLIPNLDDEEYKVFQKKFKDKIFHWNQYQLGIKNKMNKQYDNEYYNLFNAIAERRMNTLLKIDKEIF